MLEGYGRAQHWERLADRLPAEVGTLVIWDANVPDEDAWEEAIQWVSRGHRLIVAGRHVTDPGAIDTGSSGPVHPAAAHPLTAGLGQLSLGPGAFTDVNRPAMVHLARPDGAPVLVSWQHGEGRIYWSAGTQWLTNARIGEGDNLVLALRLLGPEGEMVAFDEYSHGFRAMDRWYQILRGSLQAFFLQLTAALALFFWAAGARFGSPRPAPAAPPRAAVEYVYSISQLYRQARARTVVVRGLYRNLTRALGKLLGGARGLTHQEMALRAAARTGLEAEQIAAVLNRLDPDRRPEPGEKDLIVTAREVEEIQRRVRNAGHCDQ